MSFLPFAVAAWLFLVGLYGVVSSNNLVRTILSLTIIQSSTYVLLLGVGYVNGGNAPIWGRDGKELFYTNGGKLMSVEVKTGGSTFEVGTPKLLFESRGRTYDASADGQRFLVNVQQQGSSPAPLSVTVNWRPPGTKN